MASATPESVFTPRSPHLNPDMYVERPGLERQIRNAVAGQKNIILYGESGNGKTWLYNRVFQAQSVYFTVLNLASAKLHGDLIPVLKDKLGDLGVTPEIEKKGEIRSGVMPQNIGVQVTNTTTREIIQKSDLLTLFSAIRERAGTKKAVVVFDNFEQIQDDKKVIAQIASVLILLDDPIISEPDVKILIVGVPGDIKSMIGKSSNAATISNRVTEVDEVERLTSEQASELMRRGFEEKLRLTIDVDKADLYEHISWVTDRIAQHIHEFCLSVARVARDFDNGHITQEGVDRATREWLKESLTSDYAVVEQHMNSRDTKAGRKNQTLFALGACDAEDFRNKDIEQIVRAKFPNSTKDTVLDIPGMMSKFSSSENPILRKTKKEDAYRFVSPKYRMAIRAMLEISENERVQKISNVSSKS